MGILTYSIIVSAVIKAIVLFIYLYLYWQYRERFLGIWALAWALILSKSFLDPFVFNGVKSIPYLSFFQITGAACTFLLAWGTAVFVGRKLPRVWIYLLTVLTLFSNIGIFLGWNLPLLTLLNIVMYGAIYIHTGFILFQNFETHGMGRKITALAFIATGFHQFDFPLFRPTDLAPWGYLLDSSLRLIIATSLLLTYFEKIRYDLEKREAQFRLLAENARDIIYRYQFFPSPHLDYISPAAKEITGFSTEEFYNNPKLILEIVHPDDRPSLAALTPSLPPPDTPLTFRLITKTGSQIWAEQHIVPIHDRAGKTTAIEGIIRDITARRQLEQELFRLDRLNIVGQMAANIGHEIRNPLTTVRGYLQILARKPELAKYQNNFALLLEELDRANALITEYLSLSKNRLTDLRQTNLNRVIERLFPLIQADASSTNHIIKLDLQQSAPELLLDEKEIRQLILNLIRNGLEAMEPGKTLTIRTFTDEQDIVLAIKDEGKGIPTEVLDKLGMPFFTTKDNGTGLGLAICYSIANRHHAKIQVDTGPGGTTFFVRFSRSDL